MDEFGENYCVYPFVSMTISPTGRWKICCVDEDGDDIPTTKATDFEGGKYYKCSDYSLMDFWKSDYMEHIREKMLKDQPVHECRSCKYNEKKGTKSYRQRANEEWGYLSETMKSPTYIDLKLGNTCNLNCVFCDPNSSSKVLQEWKKIGWITTETAPFGDGIMGPIEELGSEKVDYNWVNHNNFWDNVDEVSPYLTKLKFTGGEPMLNKKMFKLLQSIIDQDRAKDISVQITTNGTVISEKICNMLNQFKMVQLNFSCDGLKGTNEYIRWPLEHDKWLENIDMFEKFTNEETVTLSMQHSYGALTMLSLAEYFRWVFTKKRFGWHTFKVWKPEFMQMEVLEPATLNEAKTDLQNLVDELTPQIKLSRDEHLVQDITGIIQAIDNAVNLTHLRPKLVEYTNALDKSRGINIYDYIPRLKGHL